MDTWPKTALAVGCLGLLATGCARAPNPFHPGPPRPDPTADSVPVAYGTEEEEDVTGAVSTVAMEENQHVQDVVDMLRSQVPGLQVTELPNGDFKLRLRGAYQSLQPDDASNEPLIVIDGMPVSGSTRLALKGLNPRDVRSITVLKDVSSTAIYGSRGANGVILIAMKR